MKQSNNLTGTGECFLCLDFLDFLIGRLLSPFSELQELIDPVGEGVRLPIRPPLCATSFSPALSEF